MTDGYAGVGAVYGSMVIETLDLTADAVCSFFTDSKPTYPQFEAWIADQLEVKLDADTVKTLNESITG